MAFFMILDAIWRKYGAIQSFMAPYFVIAYLKNSKTLGVLLLLFI